MSSPSHILLTLACAHAVMVLSPGPNALLVIRSAAHSGKLGIIAALGIWPAGLFWAGVGIFGLSALLKNVPELATFMYLACGLYLSWIGGKLIYTSCIHRKKLNLTPIHLSAYRTFIAGIITNITNPKGIPYWLSIFTATGANVMPSAYRAIAIIMMPTISFSWYVLLSFVVASKTMQKHMEGRRDWIDRLAGAGMIGFGVKLLTQFM